MKHSATILANILDDNAKDLIDTVNDALLDRISTKIEEKRKEIIDSVYGNIEEKKDKNNNLADNYPPFDVITRADIIAGARGEDQQGGRKRHGKSKERRHHR